MIPFYDTKHNLFRRLYEKRHKWWYWTEEKLYLLIKKVQRVKN